jgi:DNA topoisomerase-2
MGKKSEPQIKVCLQGVNWTRITFKPDLAKFHMTHLDGDDMVLIKKRVVDMDGFLGVTVQVVFQRLKNFPDYVFCYITSATIDRKEKLPRFVIFQTNISLNVVISASQSL